MVTLRQMANNYLSSMDRKGFMAEVVNNGGKLLLSVSHGKDEIICLSEEWEKALQEKPVPMGTESLHWEEKVNKPQGHFTQGTGFRLSNPKVGTLQPRPKVYLPYETDAEKAKRRAKHESDVMARRMARLAEQPKGRRDSAPSKYGKKK